jgi:hypothetical protein
MTGVLDQDQAAQRLEGERRNRGEVQSDNRFPVIVQKRQPLFARITAPSDAPQVAGDNAFGSDQAELLQLPWILGAPQSGFSRSNFFGDLRLAAGRPGEPTPVGAESGAMPVDHSFRA